MLAEAWGEFVSVDGKVANTIRLLIVKPGELTAQYLSGHRARFLPPLRLYLVCTLAFFLLKASLPTTRETSAGARASAKVTAVAPNKPESSIDAQIDSVKARHLGWFNERMKINSLRTKHDGKDFMTRFWQHTPKVLFVLMPAFALLLSLAYRSRRRPFAAHLIMSLHLHAFMFAALALGVVAVLVLPKSMRQVAGGVELAWLMAYGPLALRRVYGGRLVMASIRMASILAVYSVLALAAIAALSIVLVFFY